MATKFNVSSWENYLEGKIVETTDNITQNNTIPTTIEGIYNEARQRVLDKYNEIKPYGTARYFKSYN